jgi:hypothetical protein
MRKLPNPKKIFSLKVLQQLEIALQEIGEIKPWFSDEVKEWVFEHPLYPESYGGDSPEEVIAGYPLYLGKLIEARIDGSLAPETELTIKGRGGYRAGAGRKTGSTKAPTKLVRLPEDVAHWLKEDPSHVEDVRRLFNVG